MKNCPICKQPYGKTPIELFEHLNDVACSFDPTNVGYKPLFRVVYGIEGNSDYAYVGFDGNEAKQEFDRLVQKDIWGVVILQGPLVIATYEATDGSRVVPPYPAERVVSPSKGRVTPTKTPADPHQYCDYVGHCIPNQMDPHVKSCDPPIKSC